MPAVHRRQDADELDARGRRAEDDEGAEVDEAELRADQAPGGDVGGTGGHLGAEVERLDLRRVHGDLVLQQHPEDPDRHPELEDVQGPPARGLGRAPRDGNREQRDAEDLEQDRHAGSGWPPLRSACGG